MRFRFSRRRKSSDWLRGIWLVVVGLVFTGATLVAEDHEADKAKSPTPGGSTADAPTPAESRLRTDVTFLAADAHEGRAPGTKGIEAAAAIYRRHLQGGRPQAGSRVPRTISSRSRSVAVPCSATIRSWRSPVRTARRSRERSKTDFMPAGDRLRRDSRSSAHRVRRLRHHRQGRLAQARLRRLRGHRRQGEGRLDHPARAPARRASPVRSTASRRPSTPPSSTRRPTPFSTVRPRSSSSTIWPSSRARRISCCTSRRRAPSQPRTFPS